MEGSILPSEEGVPGQRDNTQMIFEANKRPLPGAKLMTATDHKLRVKKVKVDNADNDISPIITSITTGNEDVKSLEQLVFSNHLLLDEIFMHSTFQDLKSHRQVNRLWNLEAMKAMWNHFSIKPIQLLPIDTNLFGVRLKELQLRVEQSRIFPCNSYRIKETHLLEDTIVNFLKTHGSIIKTLVYESAFQLVNRSGARKRVKVNGSPTTREFIQLLAGSLPNLEFLIMKTCPGSSKIESPSQVETVKGLKKLHTLKIYCHLSKELLPLLLSTATNLKQIYLFYYKNVKQLVELNASHLLKNIRFNFHGNSFLFNDQNVTLQPSCKEIETHWGVPRAPKLSEAHLRKAGQMLSEAFHKYSGTLQRLFLELPLGHVPGLRFATCPKVTQIDAVYRNPKHLPFNPPSQVLPFPLDFNLGVTFPNLRELELFLNYVGDFPLFPESSPPLLFLRVLKIHWPDKGETLPIPKTWIKQFCQLFPNITTANLGLSLDPDFGSISTFRFLEKLEFTTVVKETDEDFVRVDSLLTGFSQETVRRMYENSGAGFNYNMEDVEKLGKTGSVADLKNLKMLVIETIYPAWYTHNAVTNDLEETEFVVGSGLDVNNPILKVGRNVIISHISKMFCFDMCPNLKSNDIKYHWITFPTPRAKIIIGQERRLMNI